MGAFAPSSKLDVEGGVLRREGTEGVEDEDELPWLLLPRGGARNAPGTARSSGILGRRGREEGKESKWFDEKRETLFV